MNWQLRCPRLLAYALGMIELACGTIFALAGLLMMAAGRLPRPERQPGRIELHCKVRRVVEPAALPKPAVARL